MPEIVHWNPRQRLASSGPLWRISRPNRINNFGDLLGPWIVDRICRDRGLSKSVSTKHRLLTVGSIINVIGRAGDTVWGSGIHGNMLPLGEGFPRFDVRAVRGPLTGSLLTDANNAVPSVYGDPALLIPHLFSDSELGIQRGVTGTVYVPNYHDFSVAPVGALNPRGDFLNRVRIIASAERVIASSLHGVIIAEAYNVPTVLVASTRETPFKYEDYYEGTGRRLPSVAANWSSALSAKANMPLGNWDPQALLDAFPEDLWQ